MSDQTQTSRDEQIDEAIGGILRWGVAISAAVVLAGAVFYLARHGGETPHYHAFRGEPSDLRSVGGILRDAFAGRARGIIQLGLLLLIATPAARVFFALVAFAVQKDLIYVTVSAIVLAAVLFGLAGGHL